MGEVSKISNRRLLVEKDPNRYRTLIEECRTILSGGGIAVLPAEGLYGLHVCTDDPAAAQRLRRIKADPSGRPFIVLIENPARLERIARIDNEPVRRLIQNAWPGPLTLLLPATETVRPDLVLHGNIAVRCPGSRFLRDLAATLPGGLLSTSANRAGEAPPARLSDLDPALEEAVDLVVDGGTLANQGSTLATWTESGELQIIRPGLWTPPPSLPSDR